jgi:thioredoxin-related protein
MKFIRTAMLAAVCALGVFSLSSFFEAGEGEITIGQQMPMMALDMVDVSGAEHTLRGLHKENGLLVIFSCNTCPFVLQWEDRYNDLYELCKKNDIGMVLVNSNEAKRPGDDSMENMKAKAESEGYKMPYILDEDHVLADAFGARTTPHVFLFNRHAGLAYRGAIDDNGEDASAVSEHYLMDAVKNMVANTPISPEVTKSIGCSIKRTN